MSFARWGTLRNRDQFSVSFTEAGGSPKEHVGSKGYRSVRTLHCAWGDRTTLVKELLGDIEGTASGYTQYKPHRDPDQPYLYAIECDIDPAADDVPLPHAITGFNTYRHAVVVAKYGIPEYDVEGTDAYCSEEMLTMSEFLATEAGDMSWDADGDDPLEVDSIPGYFRQMHVWVITWHKLPYVPDNTWDLEGKVNPTALEDSGDDGHWNMDHGIGELLYGKPRPKRHVFPGRDDLWDLSITMTRKPGGWNKVPRPTSVSGALTMVPQPVYHGGVLFTPYPTAAEADFEDFLPPRFDT